MKRHILGVAIFSLIVGTTILVWSAFSPIAEVDVLDLKSQDYSSAKPTSCFTKRRFINTNMPVVKQAYLDLDTKRIDWQVYVPQTNSPIALHLFAKNADGDVHLVATEIMPSVRTNNLFKYSAKYMALKNFNSDENLYVVPEIVSREAVNTMYFDPKFDEKLAVPVTVYSGRKDY